MTCHNIHKYSTPNVWYARQIVGGAGPVPVCVRLRPVPRDLGPAFDQGLRPVTAQAANNYRIQEVSYGAVWQAVARGGIDLETSTVALLFNVASASPILFVHISSFCRKMTT